MTDHAVPLTPRSNLKKVYVRPCPECGQEFETETHDRYFCTAAHREAFHNRSSKIGRVVVPLAMAWRAGRNVKGKSPQARALRASASRALDEFCRALDAAAAEDLAAGRMKKLDYVRRRNASEGALYPRETVAYHVAEDAGPKPRKARPRVTGPATSNA